MSKIKRVFITEKPSVAELLANGLAKVVNGEVSLFNQQFKVYRLESESYDDLFVPMAGHLLENYKMSEYPEGKGLSWFKVVASKKAFVPVEFKTKLKGNDERSVFRINTIIDYLKNSDQIINAGDIDDEGQLIVDEFFSFIENNRPSDHLIISSKQKLRLWFNAFDEKHLRKALNNLALNEEYLSYGYSALARSESDWLLGANFTMLASVILNKIYPPQTQGDKNPVISVGRVQTPVLNLIYSREQEIENFKSTTFYNIDATMNINGSSSFSGRLNLSNEALIERLRDAKALDIEDRYLISEPVANQLKDQFAINSQHPVQSAEVKNRKNYPPLPLALAELQKICSSSYKMSAQETLDTAQNLYLNGFITYPRNNGCRYIPEESFEDRNDILNSLANLGQPYFDNAESYIHRNNKSKAFDSSKVDAHFAIIPTDQMTQESYQNISQMERNVFNEVARHYMYQFMNPAEFVELKAVIEHNEDKALELKVSETVYNDYAWMNAFEKEPKQAGGTLSKINKGELVTIQDTAIKIGNTQPPKYYNSERLISDLVNIYKFVSDPDLARRLKGEVDFNDEDFTPLSGLGTDATRSGIIERLIERNYVYLDKEKDRYLTTEHGRQLLKHLPDELKKPDMSGEWQLAMDNIRWQKDCNQSYQAYLAFMDMQKETMISLFEKLSTEMQEMNNITLTSVYDRENEVLTENYKECPCCQNQMTRSDFDKNGHKENRIKCNHCGYSEQEYNGVFYPFAYNAKTEHSCLTCHSPLILNSGFSFNKLQAYAFYSCTNEKCEATFDLGENNQPVKRMFGTKTEHQCPFCESAIYEHKGVSTKKVIQNGQEVEQSKPYHFFQCSNDLCKKSFNPNAEGKLVFHYSDKNCPVCQSKLLAQQIYSAKRNQHYNIFSCLKHKEHVYFADENNQPQFPVISEEPCPTCGGELILRKGVSKKTNQPYAFYQCKNNDKHTFQANDKDQLVLRFANEACFKCGSKMLLNTFNYNDSMTGELKTMTKAICVSDKCNGNFSYNETTKRVTNPYERTRTKNTGQYRQLLKGSKCPCCGAEMYYIDFEPTMRKQPFCYCSNSKSEKCKGKFYDKTNDGFTLKTNQK